MKKIKPRNRKGSDGYILIDVVVAMFILSVAFISLLSGFAFAGKIAGDTFIKAKQLLVEKYEFEKLPRLIEP
jgi:hypothetical protein